MIPISDENLRLRPPVVTILILAALGAAWVLVQGAGFDPEILAATTELVIALVVRTRRRFFGSRPGGLLLWSTIGLIAVALAIPYLPFVAIIGFVPLPPAMLAALVAITVLYLLAAEVTKKHFYRTA